jgi:ATP-binding cassette subfamily F protein 3
MPFDGDLDDYRDWVLSAARRARADEAKPAAPTAVVDRRQQKRDEAAARQRLADARKPLAAKQAAVEREMAALAAERDALDAWLASPDAYTADAKDALKDKVARQGELTWQLARLETEWLEIAEAIERASAPG